MVLLRAEGLTVRYGGETAVHEASLEVHSGEYCCIVGENGSGKSTLVKAILGLVPISGGKAELFIDKSRISYLPQITFSDPSFPATVSEVVLFGTQKAARRVPFYTKADRAAAREAIKAMEITEIAGKRIGELSGGQQQRVMLARTLCRDPELLILDEPCTGLDSEVTRELYELLRRLNKERGVAILMVSHDLAYVEKYADTVIRLSA